MRKPAALALFLAYLVVLFGLTLVFFRSPPRVALARLNLVPLVGIARFLRGGGRAMWVNVAGNLAAFVPVGLLLPSLSARHDSAGRVALVGFCLSLEIEALQFASRARVADVDDLILNTAGGLLGYLALGLPRRWRPESAALRAW